jgi:AcrR family transcriptional regulator
MVRLAAMPPPKSLARGAKSTSKGGDNNSAERPDSPVRQAILDAATTVFARHGYDAGSIDKIVRRAKTHDRMIYYYFGSKEKLFIAVLENAYAHWYLIAPRQPLRWMHSSISSGGTTRITPSSWRY